MSSFYFNFFLVQILFEAGEGIGKANVSTFINILTTRSGPQLSKSESQESVDCWVSPGQTGGAALTGDRVTPGHQTEDWLRNIQ